MRDVRGSPVPDARVVLTRRGEADLASSAASLVANQMAIQSDHADMAWITAECRRKIALRQERMDEALKQFTGPRTEVDFAALDADWEDEMARVYRELDLPLVGPALPAMRGEIARA